MVTINQSCVSCGLCIIYCPVKAISIPKSGKKAIVDQNECLECGTCYRSGICPVNAIVYTELSYPRSLRRHFSDPTSRHEVTQVPGRGTEEIKTNDVTNRFKLGKVGFCVEVGRPGVGTSIQEVEKITRSLSKYKIIYEEKNPVRYLLSNVKTGQFKKEILNEKVLSIIIEFIVSENNAHRVLDTLKDVSKKVDAVFSISLAGRILDDGTIPIKNILNNMQIPYRTNAKINLGMGRLPKGD